MPRLGVRRAANAYPFLSRAHARAGETGRFAPTPVGVMIVVGPGRGARAAE